MKNFKNLKYVENIKSIYKFGKKLGEGSYGVVTRGTRITTGTEFAIKIINKKSLSK